LGALNGSLSYTRFYVEGELPPNFRQVYTESVQAFAFEPLTAEDDDNEERTGWCNIEHPFDMSFDEYKLFYNEYLNVAMRTDRWRIPAALLKAYCTEAERKYMLENGKEKLRRGEKEEIKAVITAELKNRLLPSLKTIDVSWNTHTGIVRFWNASARVCETFQDLFEDTFGLRLVADSPYVSALQFEMTDALLAALPESEPATFHRLDGE
jgi:recombination associated protein RdgC